MEHSGGPNERKGDQKVDFSNQCNINETEELKEVKLNLLLVREELVQLKKEKILLKAHNARKHAGYEAELNYILVEKQRFSVEMVKLQSDRDLLLAKVTALEQNNAVDEVDECIEDVACQGNCEDVGCGMSQLQKLNNMKNQGGRRESPVEGTANTNCFYCPQCGFRSKQKSDIEAHVKKEHDKLPSCPFCLVGFQHQAALKRHVEEQHKENTEILRERQLSVRERRKSNSKGQCIFFLQPRGCKKGYDCDFSHTLGVHYSSVKVRKLCLNGPSCAWKPRCRYLHPEDGEIIPPRAARQETRSQYREETREQCFGTPEYSQPPPGLTMRNYPAMGQPVRVSVFRMNPQYSQ